jgi:hypothetical protein
MIYLYFVIIANKLHKYDTTMRRTPTSPPSGNHDGIETMQYLYFVVKANKLRRYDTTMG